MTQDQIVRLQQRADSLTGITEQQENEDMLILRKDSMAQQTEGT